METSRTRRFASACATRSRGSSRSSSGEGRTKGKGFVKAFLTASFDAASRERLARHMGFHAEDWRETKKIFFDAAELVGRIREEQCDVLIVEADFVQRE